MGGDLGTASNAAGPLVGRSFHSACLDDSGEIVGADVETHSGAGAEGTEPCCSFHLGASAVGTWVDLDLRHVAETSVAAAGDPVVTLDDASTALRQGVDLIQTHQLREGQTFG